MTLTLTPPAGLSDAAAMAADRFAANGRATGVTPAFPALEFCPGRDGSATAKRDGRWLGGCSVPRRAAEVMLRNGRWPGPTLLLHRPTHGHQVAACLDRLGAPHGLVVLMPSAAALADAFACCDFAEAVSAGRLFFATDLAGLDRLFDDRPGLAVPQQVVRMPDAADADAAAVGTGVAAPTLADVQALLVRRTTGHARRTAAAAAAAASPPPAAWCVVAPGHFRLWDDAGPALAHAVGPAANSAARTVVIDTDRPTTASAAALAEAAAASGVVVSAGLPRPAWARRDRPWVTWVTAGPARAALPAFDPAAPRDALILADPAWRAAALAAGWPGGRVTVGGWPADPVAATPGAPLALVADLPGLDAPADVSDWSNRQGVWDAIREELTRTPLALGDDARRYVERAPARLNLTPPADFPVDLFVARVVGPAFLLGVARWLAGRGVALTLHGRGWDAHADLAAFDRGPVADRAAFRAAVAGSCGLIDATVGDAGPAMRSPGVAVVPCFGRTPQRVLQDAHAALAGRLPSPPRVPPISRATVESLVQ